MNKKELKKQVKELTLQLEDLDAHHTSCILSNFNELQKMKNEIKGLKFELRTADNALSSAELALHCRDIREQDNAEFVSKILRSYE